MRFISFLYFLLLVYIISALIFWGISLNKQGNIIYQNEMKVLRKEIDSAADPQRFKEAVLPLEEKANIRQHQYLGEGATFLAIILIGAGVVYSSIRRNHKLSGQQKNFMLSITHELKSPLAAIKLNLQTLGKHALDEEKKQLLISRSINETNRLNDLCSNLLIASQMESRDFKFSEEKINLSLLIEDSVTEAIHRYSKHEVAAQIDPECFVKGDELLLQLLINNLLENAAKYAPAGTHIFCRLSQSEEKVTLEVRDEGIGIPNEDKTKVFQKFYRVGNEDTRRTKGTGLGLFLVEKIVRHHKGSVEIRDNEPKGTIFAIVFDAA